MHHSPHGEAQAIRKGSQRGCSESSAPGRGRNEGEEIGIAAPPCEVEERGRASTGPDREDELMDKNLYERLGVPASSDAETILSAIKSRIRNLQVQSSGQGPGRVSALEQLPKLYEARRILLDPASRTAYDQSLGHHLATMPRAP